MKKHKPTIEEQAWLVTLRPLAETWANAWQEQWKFDEKAKNHRRGSKAYERQKEREQRLDEARDKAFDELMEAVDNLPFRSADSKVPLIGTLATLAGIGVTTAAGYDRDDLYDWESNIMDEFVEQILKGEV